MQKNRIIFLACFSVLLIISVIFVVKTIQVKKSSDSARPQVPTEQSSLVTNGGTIFAQCLADFDQIKFGLIEIEPKLWLRAWTSCSFKTKDNQTKMVILPLWIENQKTGSLLVTFSQVASAFSKSAGPSAEMDVRDLLTKSLKSTDLSGVTNVTVAIGNNSGDILKFNDPLSEMLNSSIGSKMMAFGKNFDTEVLPNYPGLNKPVIFPYRVESYHAP